MYMDHRMLLSFLAQSLGFRWMVAPTSLDTSAVEREASLLAATCFQNLTSTKRMLAKRIAEKMARITIAVVSDLDVKARGCSVRVEIPKECAVARLPKTRKGAI
ncbi:uncharacterized protein HMPREF1120_02675 [Exophiala dermatitidis NIH/UT8656]|uniref:Uncharacterized protein n=1 Tax=Exophiala dermatitidis (strain ATCC 34100 / CBS 525.76 / NIH/UT8656) TaxID=858893 RepID=H6BQ61_EXODN|nr:uncharacterized protein HMPREF1120_02675 [Exophiala dermatitidis NIH/UT8656]EHY54507.1 hypothetical protein HMPREF1120_02675 [Exophiala dermatitidis NIH/UT8656]